MDYKLVEKEVEDRELFKVTVKADSNDADYITEVMYFNKSEFESNLDELKNLRDNYGGNNNLRDYPNNNDFYIPHDGWDGYCHTLEELTVEYTDENGKIWNVEF